ncbi:PEP-CTERM sorting domain-containing protein [Spirulina sp. 06S082]|uniref:PEP-CTERM sorting domain-containing protein n=1 Tax=Spirulina sp. 06S082 TaxID=3110248 RepID=UPI002B1EF309|nr:PEP-CTERM sorting domain-containing protein [Spirulina sp. 06S082]MEA5470887.1 PEP-CTERM sorting domain-containing protein [Spirulina sp. 06S082]
MKNFKKATLVGSAIATLGFMGAIAAPANAGQLYNGWNYGIDALNDGSGGENYNIRGLAIKETDDQIFVGFTGGTKWDGHNDSSAGGGKIGWGDLFFNFAPEANFTDLVADYGSYTSSQKVYDVKDEYNGSLLAIRFAPNDQGGEFGLYSVDSLKGITTDNSGYRDMNHYGSHLNDGSSQNAAMGTDLPNKTDVTDYFGTNKRILNVMETGTKLAGITQLDAAALANQGLAFNNFLTNTGAYTFGFSLDKSALEGVLPGGISDFMAHVFLECANDGVALAGTFALPEDDDETVPEPSALLGLSAIGLAFLRKRRESSVS